MPTPPSEQVHGDVPSCDPKDIALKSFFLGPQAENSAWVRKVMNDVLMRWFSWRRSLFPQDGAAISSADQENEEFLQRRRRFESSVYRLVSRYEDEVPKFSPRYIGHMFSEISLPALFGHLATLLHNPNNISRESSRVGVQIEDEAVLSLRKMVGYLGDHPNGHFTSGGTIANFESLLRTRERAAMWLAAGALARKYGLRTHSIFQSAHMGWEDFDRLSSELKARSMDWEDELAQYNWTESNPWGAASNLSAIFDEPFRGPVVLVPENKHYSWQKGVSFLGIGAESFWPISLDEYGKLSIESLEGQLERARRESRPVLSVVSVAGTTELGEVDPIDQVSRLLSHWREKGVHIWHHVDAAYGGFFCSLLRVRQGDPGPSLDDGLLSSATRSALAAIAESDSLTLDPHKLGYVPYSSGAFLCKERRDYIVKSVHAPYLQYDVSQDRGPFTIEGSRSAAGAAATWMSTECIGLDRDGYGRVLSRTIKIRSELEKRLLGSGLNIRIAPHAETNIICFTVAREGDSVRQANDKVDLIYRSFSPQGRGPFFVSKTTLTWESYGRYLERFLESWSAKHDHENLSLIRIVAMNPFFDSKEMSADFFDEFVEALRTVLENRE